jgi:DNA polymerase-3 subunit alpha
VVTYAIRITNIDPLEFGLLFERFLNPDRVSMPDIDTDFSDVRRDEVIDYVRRRYGEDRVAQIATFGTLASKAALKDVARVYGLEYKRAEQLAKLIPVRFGKPLPLAQAMEQIPELKAAMQQDEKVREVLEIARRLEGLNRHASVHAAGVVIADEPLTNLVPLMRDTKGSGVVTQYDMGSVEALGLLKMDFLGLRTLSFLDEARRIVRESAGVEIDYDNLPLDDRKIFEMLSRGDTKGVFQLEGTGMTNTVKAFKPERLHDIIAIVSLYRPGPMDNIPAYLRRRHGQEPVSYAEFPHAEEMLRPILAETYGIPVYQEQIMQIASAVAGYSLGEADMLRRAMSKKKVKELKSQRDRFITGAEKRGVPPDEASRIFDLLEAFANYGFNKSHAAAYSLISYQTAYVKAHFPVEFMAALLTVERRNSDKVAEYIRDAEASGIHVLPPDINRSGADFRVVGREILFGLSAVKNVGEGAVESTLREREKGGPYKGLPDFLKRVDLHHVNKRALESLIKAGAFDAFGERGQMLEAIEGLLKWAAAEQQKSAGGLTGLFDSEVTEPALPQVPPLEEVIRLRYEKEALGIYVTGHPLEHFPGLTEAATCKLSELERWYERNTGGKERARALLVGMVEQITRRSTRSGGMMARFNLADASGALEVVVFGRAYDRVMTRVKEDIPVVAVCEVEPDADGESLRVVVQDVFLYEELEGLPQVLELDFDLSLLSDEEILDLRSLLDEHPGTLPVFLKVRGPGGWALLESRDVRVSEEAADEASKLPGVSARFLPNRDALLAGKLGGEGQTEAVPF